MSVLHVGVSILFFSLGCPILAGLVYARVGLSFPFLLSSVLRFCSGNVPDLSSPHPAKPRAELPAVSWTREVPAERANCSLTGVQFESPGLLSPGSKLVLAWLRAAESPFG